MIACASCSVAAAQVTKLIPLSNSQRDSVSGADLKGWSKCCADRGQKRENKEPMLVAGNERA
jgi:hypothetical protein